MAIRSAGVLLYRRGMGGLQVLLVHPGGPFWRAKDIGAWQIPKGMIEPDEAPEAAARREGEEELGQPITGAMIPLPEIRQKAGKWVQAFAVEQDFDPFRIASNLFEMEWPPRSGRIASFPEVDEARWMTIAEARERMLPSQQPLLDALEELAGQPVPEGAAAETSRMPSTSTPSLPA